MIKLVRITQSVLLLLFVLGCSSVVAQSLESTSDKLKIIQMNFGATTFIESCSLLEGAVTQALWNAPDHLQTGAFLDKVTFTSSVEVGGKKAFYVGNCSLKDALKRFAETWGVEVRIKGNDIHISS
jgi:hypothetical protein